jgi:hypothetical protein
MTGRTEDPVPRRAQRAYRVLLHAYPRQFRQRFGEPMEHRRGQP